MIPEYLGDKLVNDTGKLTSGKQRLSVVSNIDYNTLHCHYFTLGTEYKEERELRLGCQNSKEPPLAKFYFLTKCWSAHLKDFLVKYKEDHGSPDLILVLSCLWDINRLDPTR